MNKVLWAIAALAILGGCQSNSASSKKSFYRGDISYTLSAEAKEAMDGIVRLQEQSYEEEGEEVPLPDSAVLPIYVAADSDRNRNITEKEALAFRDEALLEFEDQLGPPRFKPKK